MAKAKKASGVKKKKTTAKKKRPTLAALETKLARLDRELVGRLQQRATVAHEIGLARQAAGKALGPCEAISDQVLGKNPGPLPDRVLRAVFRELESGCRGLLHETRIAVLGPLYSYTHLAAIRRFGQSVEFVPVGTIAAVFEEVNRGHADFGLVPIENSTDGRIADTLDMFTRLPVRICGEVELEIHHTLLAKCARSEIKEVYSKPQALSQCRNWLAKHLPGARLIEVTSTSTAAGLAKEKPGAAAIASLQAGIHYGLDILAESIEDNAGNTTRFSVIGHESCPRSGKDRTAMMLQLEHRPGSLAEALNIFKRNRLNLTWIESFPVPGRARVYLFFVEFEGHETDLKVRRATATLEKKALRLVTLGSFPTTPPVK